MSIFNRRYRQVLEPVCSAFAAACLSMMAAAPMAQAAGVPYIFPDVPLFLAQSSRPNVFVTMDDSGSMDWEILTSPYWRACRYGAPDRPSSCPTSLIDDGLFYAHVRFDDDYQTLEYIFDDDDSIYSIGCAGGNRQAVENCTNRLPSSSYRDPSTYDWRIFSADLNVLYYNPRIYYSPWPLTDNSIGNLPDASFSSARSNPMPGSDGYDERRNLRGFKYNIWVDNYKFTGSRPDSNEKTSGANGVVDWWDDYYQITVNSSSHQIRRFSGGNNNSSHSASNVGNLPAAVCEQLKRTDPETDESIDVLGCGGSLADEQQNIANWYQYYRRRSFVAKGAVSEVIDAYPDFHYGISMINNYDNLFIETPLDDDETFQEHNNNLLNNMADYEWDGYGTPLRNGLRSTGRYFKGDLSGRDSPIVDSCQQNFNLLLTDGYWNGGSPGFGDQDGDGYSNSLADVASYYYTTDLSDLDDEVAPSDIEDEDTSHQRLINFTVAFGVKGNLSDSWDAYSNPASAGQDGWPDEDNVNLLEDDNWGNAPGCSDCAEKIDDLWHAAWNSRGGYVNAGSPAELISGLGNVLNEIAARTEIRLSSSTPSRILAEGDALYFAEFNGVDWTGTIKQYNLDIDINEDARTFSIDLEEGWSTDDTLEEDDDWWSSRRVITTKRSTGEGVEFDWPSDPSDPDSDELDINQLANLSRDPTSSDIAPVYDAYAENRLDYIRGSRADEGGSNPNFRERQVLLGDIVGSSVLSVGFSAFRYPNELEDDPHFEFRRDIAEERPTVLYFGANDGMVHGIDTDGKEVIAYVPDQVFPNLSKLTSPDYAHHYYVDGRLDAADAYFDDSWHTVLVGGLGYGGKGVFALDVTDPSEFPDLSADEIALWEFTGGDYADDMGHVLGKVTVAKIADGRWAVIFGNGYNSANGQAALFVVDLETGELIKRFVVGPVPEDNAPSNGLSTPEVIDSVSRNEDGDLVLRNFDYIADYVYAGDLYGNLWRFDITDPNPNNWSASTNPVFTALDEDGEPQSITIQPKAIYHPSILVDVSDEDAPEQIDTGYLIFFGTGRYFAQGDGLSTDQEQAFYAIWDKNRASNVTVDPDKLLVQSYVLRDFDNPTDTTPDDPDVRVVTENLINDPDPGLGSDDTGWLMDYGSDVWNVIDDIEQEDGGKWLGWKLELGAGEKVIADPTIRNDRLVFNTFIPIDDSCEVGGESWSMVLDLYNGGRTSSSAFDLDGNSIFSGGTDQYGRENDNTGDLLGGTTVASGKKLGDVLIPNSSLASLGNILSSIQRNADIILKPLDDEESIGDLLDPGFEPIGRQMWTQPDLR